MLNEYQTASVNIEYMLDCTNTIQAILGWYVWCHSTLFGACLAWIDASINTSIKHRHHRTTPNVKLCRMMLNNVQRIFDVCLVQFGVCSTWFNVWSNIIWQLGRIVLNKCWTASNECQTVSNGVKQSGFHVVKYYIIIFNNIQPNSNNSMPLGIFLGGFF